MWELLERLFGEGFMPHGHCYLWSPGMVWLQVLSNAAIGLAYVSISATLHYIVRRIEDVPFRWMYLAFGVFIVTCGATHLLDVATVWHPVYWLDGGVRAVTAVASVGTAVLLFPLVPKAVALAGAAQVAHRRGLELEAAYRDLAAAHQKTKELEDAKTQFFANASHELRTPLTLILGPVEQLLRDPALPDEHRRSLDIVLRNGRVLLAHVNDLLDVSRIEAGRLVPHYSRGDLAHVARLVGSLFESAARERNVAFYVDAPPVLPVEFDSDMIQRVLRNLLGNALKHVRPAGTVRCQVEKAGERALVTVDDDGPGVPLAMREAVFERYRQVEGDGTLRTDGTGLGLAIARELVELHGGAISVDDAPAGGARFRFEVPIAAPAGVPIGDRPPPASPSPFPSFPASHVEMAPPSPRASEPGAGPGRSGVVLVVEDNHDMRRFVRDTLASTCAVETAADGVEGLAKARALLPDLVVTDVMMPRKGGEELVADLQADPATAGIPILVLSARADAAGRTRLLEAGAQDYVVKPFAAAELLARVKRLVDTRRAREVLQAELSTTRDDVAAMAEELAARARELERALAEARDARDAAERAGAVKTNVLNLVSHELRTPLMALQLQLEVLRRAEKGRLSPRQESAVAKLGSLFDRLSETMDTLLEYASLVSGGAAAIEPVDVAGAAAELQDEMRSRAAERALTLRVEIEPDLAPLATDPHLFRVLLRQLVANAVRFTRDGGQVLVRCTMEQGRHVVAITDEGPGLSNEARSRMFEPFWQLEPVARKHGKGLGLGLALAGRITELLGGRIDVSSEPGRGTTFTVVLGGSEPQAEARGA